MGGVLRLSVVDARDSWLELLDVCPADLQRVLAGVRPGPDVPDPVPFPALRGFQGDPPLRRACLDLRNSAAERVRVNRLSATDVARSLVVRVAVLLDGRLERGRLGADDLHLGHRHLDLGGLGGRRCDASRCGVCDLCLGAGDVQLGRLCDGPGAEPESRNACDDRCGEELVHDVTSNP